MATMSEKPPNVFGPTLSRRQFVKTGGALVVGFSLVGPKFLKGDAAKTATFKNSLDPTLPSSWIEIHPDNTVLIRTGKSDFGQGSTFTAYRQIVADELSVSFEAITTVVARRHRSHAGRQRSLRFPRPWNTEHPKGGRLYLPGSARPRVRAAGRARRTSFPSRTASCREAARAFRTATSSRTSN